MIVKEKERIPFNFKEILKSFVQTKTVDNAELEKQLEAIKKQENTNRINKLVAEVDTTKVTNKKKLGKARKRENLAEKVEVPNIKNQEEQKENHEVKELG